MGKRLVLPKEQIICDECKEIIQGWFSVYILPLRHFVCFTCYFSYLVAIKDLMQKKTLEVITEGK